MPSSCGLDHFHAIHSLSPIIAPEAVSGIPGPPPPPIPPQSNVCAPVPFYSGSPTVFPPVCGSSRTVRGAPPAVLDGRQGRIAQEQQVDAVWPGWGSGRPSSRVPKRSRARRRGLAQTSVAVSVPRFFLGMFFFGGEVFEVFLSNRRKAKLFFWREDLFEDLTKFRSRMMFSFERKTRFLSRTLGSSTSKLAEDR